ncbi:MAG: alpha/beta fold hydrolase [Candidatus Methylomirabilales bacterium]
MSGTGLIQEQVVQKTRVSLRKGAIAYVRKGQGEPVLLIHGMPTSVFLWRNVIPLLAQDFTVCALDLLGYGDSDRPSKADLSVPAQAEYVAEFMMKVGLTHATIVGHDVGGGVAQLLAVDHPELVRRLILIDTVAYDSWPVPEIERFKEPAWDPKTVDLREGFKELLLRGIFHKERVTDALAGEYISTFVGSQGREAYLRCARALNSRDILIRAAEIERMSVPVLIIWGEADDFYNVVTGQRLADRLPSARLVVVKDAGHFVPEDQPEEVARLVRAFMKGTTSL